MKRFISSLFLAAAVGSAGLLSAAPASAQMYGSGGPMYGGPAYNSWQPGWDHGQYDRHHIIIGRVVSFSPYRLSVQRRNGSVQTVDLKRGTVIRPTGMTPSPGQRVAMIGYYSNGTFIVRRLVLRP